MAKEPPYIVEPSDGNLEGYTVGFILYIMNLEEVYKPDTQGNSYQDEDAIIFLQKIPANDFVSADYKVTMTKSEGKQFQQRTNLMIKEKMTKHPCKAKFKQVFLFHFRSQ